MKVMVNPALLFMMIMNFFSLSAAGQNVTSLPDSTNKNNDISRLFNGAQIHLGDAKTKPAFIGGLNAWHDYLRKNIDPKAFFSRGVKPGQYNVLIRFIIDKQGKIIDAGALTNCGYGMEAEVIRCIRKSPDWNPAANTKGEKVQFTLKQLVAFNIKSNDIEISFNLPDN